jgi:Polyketide cyclase / dehydrase and lipid transport
MRTTFTASRLLNAPADVIYHCIADYREHHRPGGFLPPAFTDFVIDRGGVGAGTELRWVVMLGNQRRPMNAVVTEPDPGRRLVETGSGVETTFSVEPAESGTLVRFTTQLDEGGLGGVLTRLFGARLMGPLYADELGRLEAYAQAHGPTAPVL